MAESEVLNLKVIVLDNKPPVKAELFWRPIGVGEYSVESLKNIERGVFSVSFPPEGVKSDDVEYYIKVTADNGSDLYFPANAPEITQTVVMIPKS